MKIKKPVCTSLSAPLRIYGTKPEYNLFDFFDNPCSNERQHNFMMARQVESLTAVCGGPIYHIGHRTVLPDEVHIYCGEIIQLMS